MPKISKAGRPVGIYGCFTETGEPSEARATAADVQACPLCMKPLQEKQGLMWTHDFCADCLKDLGLQCPVPSVSKRDQPEGRMTWEPCTFNEEKFLWITYNIPSGIQKEGHPNPGKLFTRKAIGAWLPDNPEGRDVLKLLQRAFDQKLVFTIVATNGAEDSVDFTDIPHATFPAKCQWPGFLQEVKAALRAKGIE
ncbi:hypothetical protein ANANG_G00076870 [Anguilla anguilla]|uniref:E3 ubiquitin-protein ligase n=1 Tax=Anguilla anguilla TaxID=7936 RepID=A0A9D3MMB9_ANGAN|nr:hypothetical protein ANANG_G00076870 [Anguilla anguilla]